jgi:hypothetical protein
MSEAVTAKRAPAVARYATARTDRPTAGAEARKIAQVLGTPLMPWQRQVLDVALEYEPDDDFPLGRRFVYREVDFGTPRQSGKSVLTLIKTLHRMTMCGPNQHSVYSMQSGRDASRKLIEDWLPMIEDSEFRHALVKVRRAMGGEGLWFRNRCNIEIVSNTVSAGHGRTLAEAILDEVFSDADDRREQALLPTMLTVPNAQLIVTSTAGDDTSLYWRRKVDLGRKFADDGITDDVCYFEWSAPEDCDPYDEEMWWDVMPALGYTQTIAAVRHAAKTMTEEEFCRSMLNMWMRTDQRLIDYRAWLDCQDPHTSMGGDIVLALDVSEDRDKATITAAGQRVDADVDLELVESHNGLTWVADRLIALRDQHHPRKVLVDGTGPAAALVPELIRAGLDMHVLSGAEVTRACGAFYDHVLARRLHVRPDVLLDDAVTGAVKRQRGDSFVWRRSRKHDDIHPLMAASLAVWGIAGDPNHGALWVW